MAQIVETREFTHFHFFCGLGGGARGFNRGAARLGNRKAKFRCLGGVDSDARAIKNFNRLTGAEGTIIDLFDLDQYRDFHGNMPHAGWPEATPEDVRRAAGYEFPDVVFLSAPCKGFSGLLSQTASTTLKYQALNRLTLRGIWLMLEAFQEDLPKLIIFENVPRIMTRGRPLLDQIKSLLRHYGYAVEETTHDCGEIGNLAQSRKRFLLVARHEQKVPPFLYEPAKRSLRGVGEVLDLMPLPGDPAGGPMHRIPSLQWKTWVRLAFVEAGQDWRSLNRLQVDDGYLSDYLIVPDYHHGYLGVRQWDETAGTVAGRSTPSNGAFSVADMRPPHDAAQYSQYGVMRYDETSGVVSAQSKPGGGVYSVADPRTTHGAGAHTNKFRIVPWQGPAGAVTGSDRVGSGAPCVQAPRPAPRTDGYKQNKYRLTAMDEAAGTVIAASTTGNGAFAVADPRPQLGGGPHRYHETQGHYGVTGWEEHSRAVPGHAKHDNGYWSVADGRQNAAEFIAGADEWVLPGAAHKLICIIRAEDGTWHRPFTTLELAALQSLIDLDDPATWAAFAVSDSDSREQIGNAVPPDSARAIADVMLYTLLLAEAGQTFVLTNDKIWVQPNLPLLTALSVDSSMRP